MPEPFDPPSGRQLELSDGDALAVVTEVGGGIRAFEVGGDPILLGYGETEMCAGGKGQILLPWPNRLAGGTYSFGGTDAEAALDEPERQNAIHGLVRWARWEAERHSASGVTMSTRLETQPGYPWRLEVEAHYELAVSDEVVLSITLTARNRSDRPAPFGAGMHPYVYAGGGVADSCHLRLAATTRLVNDELGRPIATAAVDGTEYDFADGRSVGPSRLDDCYVGLESRGAEVTRPDGRVVRISGGPEFPYLMCYTADTLAPPDRRRGIAVEPMTCPPNAFNSGESVVVLPPGGKAWSGRIEIATGR